ncbi:MAG: hypothetical protein R3B58_06625 [Phycisphaerales bacterium]|nr:hypothetical protein [Phycisphaerales bacterium]
MNSGVYALAHQGFVLVELCAVCVVAAIMLGLLLPLMMGARREARLVSDIGKFHQISSLTNTYGFDFTDHFPTFSWQENSGGTPFPTPYPDLQFANSNLVATTNQATHLIRALTGRDAFPQTFGWIPYRHQ